MHKMLNTGYKQNQNVTLQLVHTCTSTLCLELLQDSSVPRSKLLQIVAASFTGQMPFP